MIGRLGSWLLAVASGLGCRACSSSAAEPEKSPPSPFFSDRVLNIAHAGGKAVAPEETLLAFHATLHALLAGK